MFRLRFYPLRLPSVPPLLHNIVGQFSVPLSPDSAFLYGIGTPLKSMSAPHLSLSTRYPPPLFSVMFSPDPPQEAGVQLGDILEQLDGVHLGSFQDAIEKLKQRRGTVVITLLRQKDY